MTSSPEYESGAAARGGAPAPGGARYEVFAHLTAPNSVLYRAVMGVFVRAKEQFRVHLRPEEVHAGLPEAVRPTAVDPVAEALTRLHTWGNLREDPDTERVTAVEDFYRRRHIYQLTREGEAAERALAVYDEALGATGALQAVALADIATQLRALLKESCRESPDEAVVHLTLHGLVARFGELADNASAFMGSLQRTIDLHDADVDAFLAYKDHLIAYLERFIGDLITRGSEIASLLIELNGDGGDTSPAAELVRIAARREAADAAPGRAPETADTPAADRALERALEQWRHRWAGLCSWFLSTPGAPAQSHRLRSAARTAVPQLLRVVAVLNERRTGRSDRSADFRTLARWFAQAPDDDARHRLWRTAFALHPSRHLVVDPDTAERRERDPVPPGTSWAQDEPITISPRLRRTGSYERRGRARKVIDRSAERRYLAELARKQAGEAEAARARLATRGPVRLSDLGELDPAAFGLFLQLLGDALARWGPGTTRTTATSNDGTMEIRLSALPDGRTATVHTPEGTFRGPDHLVDIVDLTREGPR
ncbi:TIGR02677 family protein [Nocardiopsis sp. CC223A]|uniref:TIGR02677 family protein n=1 Tax=Nocardiopsis sp. CC223A TaxID=3044051 RepID=UPI00278C6035|nr:TIGR02677 family protein [Nocardiopsis sp. CC223A]